MQVADAVSDLHFQSGSGQLLIRPFRHGYTGSGLVLVEQRACEPRVRLSKREHEVLLWLREGKTNGEIAAILGISQHTVKRHVEKVLQKLDAPNRAAASARAERCERSKGAA